LNNDRENDHELDADDQNLFRTMEFALGKLPQNAPISVARTLFALAGLEAAPLPVVRVFLNDRLGGSQTQASRALAELGTQEYWQGRKTLDLLETNEGIVSLSEKGRELLCTMADGYNFEFDEYGNPFDDDWSGDPKDQIDARIEWVLRGNNGLL